MASTPRNVGRRPTPSTRALRSVTAAGVMLLASSAAAVAQVSGVAPVHTGTPWWVWLIVAIIVLAILFAVMRRSKGAGTITTTGSPQGDPASRSDAAKTISTRDR